MAEPLLTQIFGVNATQDINSLTIAKSDLVAVGFTPASENTGESQLAAIVALAQIALTQENIENNPDQSIYIEDGFPSLVTRNNINYRQQAKNIVFEKPDTQSDFDPDDY